ncbi:hypothetical protein A3C28_06120 [Candidatus Roizmanbacteria bacterium RIFCSPHIGHO2_02_FULL_39_9]|uniref:Uncharacterized protein n=1 Tax=Candidatus Roizmanbacteria bacterium RIFCSPHIGHO2_02_FULL_39_9 TaxID=1802040 RepID=A0A1F7H858_9BACT|nr:MAG: hypothetical protein A3C28_06120 [Candidatus Roizmanbacteria bacterium RIFCSPHIGHO2_02_FULL_39_9]
MTTILLGLHIIGALVTGLFILKAFILLWKNQPEKYQSVAANLGFSLIFQVGTGSLLALLSKEMISPASFCSKILLYLAAVAIAEFLLFRKMRSKSRDFFPDRIVATSFIVSIITTVSVVFYLQF